MLTSNRNPIPHIFIPEISSLTRISKTINRNRILFTNLIIEITILIRFLYTKSIPAKRLNTIESATSKHCFAIFIFSRIPSSANIPLLRTRKANIMKIASYIKYLLFFDCTLFISLIQTPPAPQNKSSLYLFYPMLSKL